MATNNNNRNFSNFPFGFDNGVLIQNVQQQPAAASNAFWVGNNPVLEYNEKQASDSNKGTYHSPFSTIAYAISQCSANNNNIIYVREGYTQTIIAAGGLNFNVAGVTLIGLGQGANRPTLTFSTSTAATCTITAANVNISGIVGVSGIDQIVSPFVVSAAGCSLDIEWQDSASNVEAVRAVLTTAAADNFKLNLVYKGQTGGTHCVNAVRLVGCDGGKINMDFYGKASTSIVEFLTTACTNIEIGGYFYNSGTTDASKDVVDTVTGSTWFAYIEDGAAGGLYSGGSASALAPTTPAALNVPTADSTANSTMRDVVGNKTDAAVAAVSTTKSLVAYEKGNLTQTLKIDSSALSTTPTAGSVADFMEKCVVRAAANLPQTTASNLFTVTGAPIEIIEIIGEVTTIIQNQANATKLKITDTASSTTTDICSTTSIANAAVGTFFNVTGTFANGLVVTPGGTSISEAGRIICPVGAIKLDCAASNTGQVRWYLRYRAMGTGAVVAAA
jgi:hypothetical protein